jgi:arylsulfatase
MPARHNMLTGLTARVHGYPDNCRGFGIPSWIPTFPRLLSDNMYETHSIGKNDFYPLRRHHGYGRVELMTEVPAYREQDDYALYLKDHGLGSIHNIRGVRNLLYMVPQRSLIPLEHHGTNWVGDRAVRFIRTNGGRHPFLLKASWIAPHPPFDVPDEHADPLQRSQAARALQERDYGERARRREQAAGGSRDISEVAPLRQLLSRSLYYAIPGQD